MAKKKGKPDKDRSKHRQRLPRDVPRLPDPRVMEGVMREVVGKLVPGEMNTPSAKAQDILRQAYHEPDDDRRSRLAKDALETWPDCADAYVLLAEQARNRKEALRLYEQGVAAGTRALGPVAFERAVGHFWGVLETRPYMRARLGLAHSLWTAGCREEAVQHLQEMLRLNPDDNQGLRYTLAGFLLFMDRDADLAALLEQYPEESSAAWAYSKALLSFRRTGDNIKARQLLKQARKTNKYVPAYLLGEKYPPADEPGYYSPSAESEALSYIGSFMAAWKSTPGAVAWLRDNVKKKQKEASAAKGPSSAVKSRLAKNMSQEHDIWQGDFRRIPNWVEIGGTLVRPWFILVISRSNALVLAHDMRGEAPSAALLWDTLIQAMQHPVAGEAHRPTELEVRHDPCWEALRPHLDEIGVALTGKDELDVFDQLFNDMTEHVCGQPEPGLLDMPGVTPEQVGSFYAAAAAFFRQTPWKKVGYEAAIKVECDKFQSGPWYAVLMGQSGLTMGLALYEDLRTLQRLWSEDLGDEESARQTVATSVTFGEEPHCPIADLEACEKHGWEVARPDGYPEVIHKERGLAVRPPLAWELELMEGCLRAVPEFIGRHKQDDPAQEQLSVRVASGELRMVLSWVM